MKTKYLFGLSLLVIGMFILSGCAKEENKFACPTGKLVKEKSDCYSGDHLKLVGEYCIDKDRNLKCDRDDTGQKINECVGCTGICTSDYRCLMPSIS